MCVFLAEPLDFARAHCAWFGSIRATGIARIHTKDDGARRHRHEYPQASRKGTSKYPSTPPSALAKAADACPRARCLAGSSSARRTIAEETDPPSSADTTTSHPAKIRALGASAAPAVNNGASTRLARIIRRRPKRSASRARSKEPSAEVPIHANNSASFTSSRLKVFAIQGDATPTIESV